MKNKIKIIISAMLCAFTCALLWMAKNCNEWFFTVYPPISKTLVSALSDATAFAPFDIWEIITAVLLISTVSGFVISVKKKQHLRWGADVILAVSVIVFMFVGLWALNYYAPSMSSRLSLNETLYTPEELREATQYYCDLASEYSKKVERDENGLVKADFCSLAVEAGDCYRTLSEDMPMFDGSFARVKKLITGKIFTMRGTTGIFICITGESNVSEYVFSRSMPFTMCHEIGHRMAFARENEANFAAFLACTASDSDIFLYSGYYQAFIYCYNALYKADRERAISIIENRSDELIYDLNRSKKHYADIEIQKAVEVSDAIYEQYLQSFDVESGMQSYGEVADLLIQWYFQRIK